MKKLILLSLALIFASAMLGQTSPNVTQPKLNQELGVTNTGGLLKVVLPSGLVSYATLGAGIVLDTTTTPPSIRLVTPTVSLPTFVSGENLTQTGQTATLANTPIVGSVTVYRNGLRQKALIDYAIAGSVITFVAHYPPNAADIIMADYQRPPAPTAGNGLNFRADESTPIEVAGK